jgi:hypothetical protein
LAALKEFSRFEAQRSSRRNIDVTKDVRSLVKEHHAFYEVIPYYVLLDEKHGSLPATNARIQAGFDVDIYGVNPDQELTPPGADLDYALGYAELQKIVEKVSNDTSGCCSLELIPFPSRIVVGGRTHAEVQGMLRIRISPRRGLDRAAAGLAEEQALKELERQLHQGGLARR